MKNLRIAVSIIASAMLSSCATVFSGTGCKVSVNDGLPAGGKVYLNGNYIGLAPCKVKVSKNGLKNNQTKLVIKAEGYQDQEIILTRKVKVAAIIGNVLFTGGIGLIIDFADGAIYKATPGKINYNLDKK